MLQRGAVAGLVAVCWVVAAAAASVRVWRHHVTAPADACECWGCHATPSKLLAVQGSVCCLSRPTYLAPEAELPDTLGLVVIPYHDLWCIRAGTTYVMLPSCHAWCASTAASKPMRQRGATLVTLVGGYLGAGPPPTMARMLQRNSISTMPMPPLLNPRQNCSRSRSGCS